MTPLNARQSVKIKAGLCLIHDYGHNARLVSDAARSDMARGLAPKQAYERAFTEFTKGKPELSRALSHTLRLIEASDPLTVGRYGDAIEQYNQTGDPAAMTGIAQTFAQDSIALAIRNGELSEADARDPAAVEAAFGFTFGPGVGDKVIAMASAADVEAAPASQAAPATQAAPAPNVPASLASISPAPTSGPRTGFDGGSGWQASARPGSRGPSFQPIIRQKAEPGSGPVIEKAGWIASDTYG